MLPPAGCLNLYWNHAVPVSVRDAETGAPIAGARVSVDYFTYLELNHPAPGEAITDSEGNARIRWADNHGDEWSVSAGGYVPRNGDNSFQLPFKGVGKPPGKLVFHLYRAPRPELRIIVPNGYSGAVRLRLLRTSGFIQGAPGQRCLVVRLPRDGYVAISATPLLQRMSWFWDVPKLTEGSPSFCYEDGSSIPDTRAALDLARPNLVSIEPCIADYSGSEFVYVIGTEAQREQTKRDLRFGDEELVDPKRREKYFSRLFPDRPATQPSSCRENTFNSK